MTVLPRLLALYQTVEANCSCDHCEGHKWTPLRGERPRLMKMRPVTHRDPTLALWDEVDRMPIGGTQRYLNRTWSRIADQMYRNLDRTIIGLTVQ